MAGFSDILDRGKKRFKVKNKKGAWGGCDYCDDRHLLFPYYDSKSEMWMLCDTCSNTFIEEEE